MNEFYKLDKFLFEDDKYKNLKLNSKIAYCILKDMLDENINVKTDINGDRYIKDARIYLMQKLKNIITVKEISSLDVIFANEFINKFELKKIDFEYKKIEKIILWNQYTSNEKDFIRVAIKYITRKKERGNFDRILKNINNDIIQEALLQLKQSERKGNIMENFINIIDKIT